MMTVQTTTPFCLECRAGNVGMLEGDKTVRISSSFNAITHKLTYCLFHTSLPSSQSQHILQPIFEVSFLAQY